MDGKNDGNEPNQGSREALSVFIMVLLLFIVGFCGYCMFMLVKMIIEGVAAGLSQLGSATSGALTVPSQAIYLIASPSEQPDVYTMTAARLEPLLSVITVVGYVLLGAVILALAGIAVFVILAVHQHFKDGGAGGE